MIKVVYLPVSHIHTMEQERAAALAEIDAALKDGWSVLSACKFREKTLLSAVMMTFVLWKPGEQG